ncbi:MAG: acyl-protein synthetase [Gammaproteobacteria bacterium]
MELNDINFRIRDVWNNAESLYDVKNPYSFSRNNKIKEFLPGLVDLTSLHMNACKPYKNIISSIYGNDWKKINHIENLPFIPVRSFKNLKLSSIGDEDVLKTLTSSGTSGQKTSQILLDKETSIRQSSVLVSLTSHWIGSKRRPMLIFDTKASTSSRYAFNARAAGILGFSQFGRKPLYCLDEDMNLDIEQLEKYIYENKHIGIFGFGFTFMLWQSVYRKLKLSDKKIDCGGDSVILHGGGWKKIENQKVSREKFNHEIIDRLGVKKVINYYGMVEQVGSIFFECQEGHFHCPNFSEIIIRHPITFEPQNYGEPGLIQLLSLLPTSYPGHSILTEDIGSVLGDDDCRCGLPGRYFEVYGRQEQAEARGCSDVANL